MKKQVKDKALPLLPRGFIIASRPENIELMTRSGSGKWISTIEHLKSIDGTDQAIQMPTKGLAENNIQAIKQGIRNTAHKMDFKGDLRFCLRDEILYVWSN